MLVADEIIDVQTWLLTEGRQSNGVFELLQRYVERLHQTGFPIERIYIGSYILRSHAVAVHLKYERDDRGESFTEDYPTKEKFIEEVNTAGTDAPFRALRRGDPSARIRAGDSKIPADFQYLFEDGFTDLFCLPFRTQGEFLGGISWATRREGGLSETDVAFFEAVHPAFQTVYENVLHDIALKQTLTTYLGVDPGKKVYAGSIDRGDIVTIKSVIWFSDIRGFTRLSDQMTREGVMQLINSVFVLTEEVLIEYGGEILKFMGDGILAIFPEEMPPLNAYRLKRLFQREPSDKRVDWSLDKEKSQAEMALSESSCVRARKAATCFQERLLVLLERRRTEGLVTPTGVGVGLHFGDCSYGNVGTPNRLDFTVIGPAVNLASRVEGLCAKLSANVLATREVVEKDSNASDWTERGSHTVKGFEDPVLVYELRDSTNGNSRAG